jgi:DNA-binding transcriptional MerR regulator
MKMRDLEHKTGVNRETIRVYFRHNLLPAPTRPKPNVADYDESHVRAIIAVRDLQKNNGLTLRQIKAVLAGVGSDRHVDASAFQNLEALVATRVGLDDHQMLIESLLEVWPHAKEDSETFEKLGLIEIIRTKNGPALSMTDSRLVTIWGEMRSEGYTAENGFPADIVEFYRQPAEQIAKQESARFLRAVQGKMDEHQAAALFQVGIRLMIDFFGLLRIKALMRHLHAGALADQLPVSAKKVKGPPKKAG